MPLKVTSLTYGCLAMWFLLCTGYVSISCCGDKGWRLSVHKTGVCGGKALLLYIHLQWYTLALSLKER